MNRVFCYLSLSLLLFSCDLTTEYHSGNGNVVKEDRNISDFHSVKTSGSIEMEIIQADNFSVEVENDENLLEYVITEVHDDVLEVSYRNGSYRNEHSKVFIRAPWLNEVISSGSADIYIRDVLKNKEEIRFRVSGSGNISGEVDAPSINYSGFGSGNINLSGRTKNFTCDVKGSGDVKCQDLLSENTDVKVSGSSNVKVFASVNLKVWLAGSGDVTYRGNPPNPDIKIIGSGTLNAE